MKRASLTVPPAKPKAEATDFTDRLLPREGMPAPKRSSRKGGSETRPDASRLKAKPAPRAPKSSSTSTSVQAVAKQPVDTPVDEALAQSRAALTALHMAANDVPARYEIAIRVRLDVLAHHIQQVTEYLEAYTRK
jgi:hypothetical protein